MKRGYRFLTTALLLVVHCQVVLAGVRDLQPTISSAHPGDTLVIPSGTYTGNLLVNKRLTLIGAGRPVIRGDNSGSVITITADSCIVKGIAVEHSGTMLVNEDAGILIRSNGNRIETNELRDVLFGIYLYHAEHNVIINNRVGGRAYLDLGERGSGIHVWNSNFNTFIGNSICDARDGFYIQNASHLHIEGNEAFNVRYGLHYMYADSNVFLGNKFYDNVAGAAIMYSSGIMMRHNVFSHNRGFASFGILFQDCHGLVADSNIISDNVVGMFFEASTHNQFRYNIIARNDVALQMFQNAIGNTFTENSFIDNLNPLTIVGKRTETHWSENRRGNYWTQYDGYDLDGDGIGDVPLKIQDLFNYLEGQNVNTRLYLYSPASQALAVAAKAFPILDLTNELDEYPLMQPVGILKGSGMNALSGHSPRAGSADMPVWVLVPCGCVALFGFVYRQLARKT
jgi:nitrous oxidase accessory protein